MPRQEATDKVSMLLRTEIFTENSVMEHVNDIHISNEGYGFQTYRRRYLAIFTLAGGVHLVCCDRFNGREKRYHHLAKMQPQEYTNHQFGLKGEHDELQASWMVSLGQMQHRYPRKGESGRPVSEGRHNSNLSEGV